MSAPPAREFETPAFPGVSNTGTRFSAQFAASLPSERVLQLLHWHERAVKREGLPVGQQDAG